MATFKVLGGNYNQVEGEHVNPLNGVKEKLVKKYGANAPNGDIVESKLDLEKLFNTPSSKKFQRLDGGTEELQRLSAATQGEANAKARLERALAKMSVRDLIEYAEAEEIDLGKLNAGSKKEDVLKAILKGQGAQQLQPA
jgi:hypothetical protein